MLRQVVPLCLQFHVYQLLFQILQVLQQYPQIPLKTFEPHEAVKNMKEGEQLLFCYLCKAHCVEASKHCSQCDRCVFNFDHHCQWLNNCVGQSNYRYFFGLIVATMILISAHLSICLYTIILYFQDRDEYILNVAKFYKMPDYDSERHILLHDNNVLEVCKALFGLTWIIFIIEIPFMIGIAQLVFFHIYLIRTGQSTFEYITQKQQKQKDQEIIKLKEKMKKNGVKHREQIKQTINHSDQIYSQQLNQSQTINQQFEVNNDLNNSLTPLNASHSRLQNSQQSSFKKKNNRNLHPRTKSDSYIQESDDQKDFRVIKQKKKSLCQKLSASIHREYPEDNSSRPLKKSEKDEQFHSQNQHMILADQLSNSTYPLNQQDTKQKQKSHRRSQKEEMSIKMNTSKTSFKILVNNNQAIQQDYSFSRQQMGTSKNYDYEGDHYNEDLEIKEINKNDLSIIALMNDQHHLDRPENSFEKQLQRISHNSESNNEYDETNRMTLNRNSELSMYHHRPQVRSQMSGAKVYKSKKGKKKRHTSNIQNLMVTSGYASGVWQMQNGMTQADKQSSQHSLPFITNSMVEKNEFLKNLAQVPIQSLGKSKQQHKQLVSQHKINEPESEPPYQFSQKHTKHLNSLQSSQQDMVINSNSQRKLRDSNFQQLRKLESGDQSIASKIISFPQNQVADAQANLIARFQSQDGYLYNPQPEFVNAMPHHDLLDDSNASFNEQEDSVHQSKYHSSRSMEGEKSKSESRVKRKVKSQCNAEQYDLQNIQNRSYTDAAYQDENDYGAEDIQRVGEENEEDEESEGLHEQDDLSKKFEAILSGSGAFIMNKSDYEDDSNLEQPNNQIISDENQNIFDNNGATNNQPGQKKTRNQTFQQQTQIIRFEREKDQLISGLLSPIDATANTNNKRSQFSKVRRIHNFSLEYVSPRVAGSDIQDNQNL
ncbi:probable s-acyltransferase at1g69420-like [Stylonychia lemnae]|uniref:Probable s-acyltransferase at1g69420-like n=1 Tax=Stylonychia lemnae TaxID=5949 RepID=A0A078A0B3_STYLE|nr:probable s-acyltransferase at1g69420-like [Stylonychia lemnae]|eukprot:CDW75585.1 probable s-acyltransferase at1g69420-like [Stylonychia lemnae]